MNQPNLKTMKRLYLCRKSILLSPIMLIGLQSYVHASVSKSDVPVYYTVQSIIKGTVKDGDGNPISGATVKAKGGTTATLTDKTGGFEISVTSSNTVLVFSSVGFKTVEVTASAATQVILTSSSENLEEVVVVGYGAQKKSDLTGSMATVSSKSLENILPIHLFILLILL